LQKIRDAIIYENPCFFDPGEIEPCDLIDFLLKKLHLENNHVGNPYSKLFCMDNDRNIFNEQNILKKYMINFSKNFKSFISDNFFGHFEIIKFCSNCNKKRYYFESFFYLTIDISQAINNGLNPMNTNFIIQCFQMHICNNINKMDFCPFCNNQTNHLENKKIFAFPINLIICIKYKQDKMNNQNICYPINLSNLGNIQTSYNLTGLIKRYIMNEEKFFVSIYADSNNWVVNDGYQSQLFPTPFAHTQGQVIMLFYNLNNAK
jgi:ribosomal protein L33